MRTLRVSILLLIIALLLLVPMIRPTQQVKAAGWDVAPPGYEVYYTVRYSCIVGPDIRGEIEGEWFRDCLGNITGWGWEPGHNCSSTDFYLGSECYSMP